MRIEDVPLYAPCQPHWLCVPLWVFCVITLDWIGFFIRIIYREYLKFSAHKVRRLRRTHYRDRQGGGRPTNIK